MNVDYYEQSYDATENMIGITSGIMVTMIIISTIICILMLVGMWKVFSKAGKPGWAAIIPIYNIYVLCQIVQKEWWYTILMFVPFANIYATIMLYNELSKKFGKGVGFTVGLILVPFIFIPILGFDKKCIYMTEDSNYYEPNQNNLNNQYPNPENMQKPNNSQNFMNQNEINRNQMNNPVDEQNNMMNIPANNLSSMNSKLQSNNIMNVESTSQSNNMTNNSIQSEQPVNNIPQQSNDMMNMPADNNIVQPENTMNQNNQMWPNDNQNIGE